MFDPMSDLTDDGASTTEPAATPAPPSDKSNDDNRPAQNDRGGGQYGKELHSITIHARQRTFYIDLKESSNGKFFKVSEKSRGGRKSTIMFDSEDLDEFIKAFTDMKGKM